MKKTLIDIRIPVSSYACVFFCALGSVACDPDDSQVAPEGELGQGTFEYRCALPSDSYCSSSATIDSFKLTRDFGGQTNLPDAVAVGSLFELHYVGQQRVAYLSAASELDEAGSGIFSVNTPASAAFLAWNNDDDVVDFTLIDARPVASLSVWQNQLAADVVELNQHSSVDVTVTPLDEQGTLLAGALPYEWLSQDTDVVKLSNREDSMPSRQLRNLSDVRFIAENPGVATVSVESGNFQAQVKVVVK